MPLVLNLKHWMRRKGRKPQKNLRKPPSSNHCVDERSHYKFHDNKLKGILFVVIIVVDWLISFDKLYKMVIFSKTSTQKKHFFRS